MELFHEEGISQDRLTEIVDVDKAATVRAVKSLEKKKLVRREINQEDKRNKKLYLTDKGKKLYPDLVHSLSDYNKQLTSKWSEEQYEMVYELLKSIQKHERDS
ncbi:MarR family transcriptional regulator [Peptoniphilus sp. KCTC 25270]|uniref:MarR family winged helix-turn-helix transcriptional regulator n=1 Tax=Peptoniphilus sp. KCTC 25270 TaxID=2897414 RepID=UPI001E3453B7|nr:MarR family transcriptional regulator [Peptoniphilus sp. KCTC 25270]